MKEYKNIQYDIISLSSGDVLLLRWDLKDYDISEIHSVADCLGKTFPNNKIVGVPKDIDLTIIRSDEQYDF